MIFLLGLFNSVIFMFINVMVGLYVCSRFFRVMRSHSKLVSEIAEFNYTVGKSRASLDYIGHKVSDAMKEIEGDINNELKITHRLTQLSCHLAEANQRFTNLEENVIELVRTDYNMESVKIETPASINDEVKKVLSLKQPVEKKVKTGQKRRKFSTTTFMGIIPNGSSLQNPAAPLKFTALPSLTETNLNAFESCSENKFEDDGGKPRLLATPVVQLLSEQRPKPEEKPIGFRPSWKCNA